MVTTSRAWEHTPKKQKDRQWRHLIKNLELSKRILCVWGQLQGTKKLSNHRNYHVASTFRTPTLKKLLFSWQMNAVKMSKLYRLLVWTEKQINAMSFLFPREQNFPRETITTHTWTTLNVYIDIIVFNGEVQFQWRIFLKWNGNFRPTILHVYVSARFGKTRLHE